MLSICANSLSAFGAVAQAGALSGARCRRMLRYCAESRKNSGRLSGNGSLSAVAVVRLRFNEKKKKKENTRCLLCNSLHTLSSLGLAVYTARRPSQQHGGLRCKKRNAGNKTKTKERRAPLSRLGAYAGCSTRWGESFHPERHVCNRYACRFGWGVYKHPYPRVCFLLLCRASAQIRAGN